MQLVHVEATSLRGEGTTAGVCGSLHLETLQHVVDRGIVLTIPCFHALVDAIPVGGRNVVAVPCGCDSLRGHDDVVEVHAGHVDVVGFVTASVGFTLKALFHLRLRSGFRIFPASVVLTFGIVVTIHLVVTRFFAVLSTGFTVFTFGGFAVVGVVFHALTSIFATFGVTGFGAVGVLIGLVARGATVTSFTSFVGVFVFTVTGFLLFFLLTLKKGSKIFADINNIIERFSGVDTVEPDTLVDSERDHGVDGAQLVVQVDAIRQGQLGDFLIGDTEEVAFVHPLVALDEVPTAAGELRLDHTLDAGVFDHIEEVLGDSSGGASSVTDTLDRIHEGLLTGGRIESVAHFVGDEHISDFLAHVIPAGHNEYASLDIERSRLNRLVLDGDILGGHEPCEIVGGNPCSGSVRYGLDCRILSHYPGLYHKMGVPWGYKMTK